MMLVWLLICILCIFLCLGNVLVAFNLLIWQKAIKDGPLLFMTCSPSEPMEPVIW